MSAKAYINILKYGVYASLFSVFLVFRGLLFPYITSKQIVFNVLMEVLFVFWAALMVKYPEYRPKKNWMTYGLYAFFAALLASCFVSVDFNLSFWGDIERMLGVFHLLHFLILYLIVITAFRNWRDWKIFFIISIINAIFVSIYGLQTKHFSTIGNTAYVSAYLIFNIYFCLILFFKEKKSWYRWLYFLPYPFYYYEFRNCDTTGAWVGLGFSIIVLIFLYGILNKNKKMKIATISVGLILVAAVSFLIANKDKSFVKNSNILRPINGITFQKSTFQTRLISWRAAAKDFKNHPILGTGHGNYAIIFDKYFDPTFYDYTRSETYFDRAHNNLIDIASTSGALGLVTYLSIFLAAGFYLIYGYRRDKFNVHDFSLISGLMIAYFVQNLAVFDSLVTYLYIMPTLGYIYWNYNKPEEEEEISEARGLENGEIYALVFVGAIMLITAYQYNVKVWRMLNYTIAGQIAMSQEGIEKTIELYRKAFSYNTPLDRDSITSFNRLFMGSPGTLSSLGTEKAREVMNYNIELAKKVVDYNPGDSLNQMMYAQILDMTGYYYREDPDKYAYYSNQAMEAIDKSIAASPGRIPIYYQKAQIYMNRGEQDKVLETMKYAISLNEKYPDSWCHTANTYLYYKQEAEAMPNFDKCIDTGGHELLSPVTLVQGLITYYDKLGDTAKVIKLYFRLTQLEQNNAKNWVSLAQLYAKVNDKQNAIDAAKRAGELDPNIKDYADQFISTLQ